MLNFVSYAASVAELMEKNRVLNHSLNHPAYLMLLEPKLLLRKSLSELWRVGLLAVYSLTAMTATLVTLFASAFHFLIAQNCSQAQHNQYARLFVTAHWRYKVIHSTVCGRRRLYILLKCNNQRLIQWYNAIT